MSCACAPGVAGRNGGRCVARCAVFGEAKGCGPGSSRGAGGGRGNYRDGGGRAWKCGGPPGGGLQTRMPDRRIQEPPAPALVRRGLETPRGPGGPPHKARADAVRLYVGCVTARSILAALVERIPGQRGVSYAESRVSQRPLRGDECLSLSIELACGESRVRP